MLQEYQHYVTLFLMNSNNFQNLLGYSRLRCVDDISRRCSDDISGNFSSNLRDEREVDQMDSTKKLIEPENLPTDEEDEMEDTVSPLGGEMSFDEMSRSGISPRLEHKMLERSASSVNLSKQKQIDFLIVFFLEFRISCINCIFLPNYFWI